MTASIEKFIVCDDIRIETSGKLLIVGLYSDDIIVIDAERFPYKHPSLCLFFHGESDSTPERVILKIFEPNGDLISERTIPACDVGKRNKYNVIINLLNFPFKIPGEYNVELNIDQDVLKASFTVLKAEIVENSS